MPALRPIETLRFGPVVATKRGCPPVLAGIERGVLEALAATTDYRGADRGR